jgi:trimeric autotransporter adhesin
MKFNVSHLSVISFTPKLPRNIFHNRSAIPSRGGAKQLAKVILGGTLLCLLLAAPGAWAQIRSATITGLVTDPTGAVVPAADVIVTETATSVSYSSKTDGKGLFTVPYLAAGDYTVTITKAGFEKSSVNNLHLDSAQTVRQDVKLTIGAANEQVEVNASTQQLNTEDGSLSGITPAAVIDVIPNVTNNPFQYAQLQNGIIPGSATQSTTSPTGSFGIGTGGRSAFTSFSVDGAQQGENNIMIDGLPIVAGGNNDPAVIPNLEGIQSVQVLTNAYSAEYGRGAGQFSITSKSGTNKFHGLVSYANRNEALMANTAANKAVGTRRPAFKVNNIGAEVDGPILKDRLFFTSSFHYLSHNYGSPETLHVPTALERVGDFGSSYVAGSNGLPTPVQVFNPFSVTAINSNLYQRNEFPKSTNCSSNPVGSYGCGDVIQNPNSAGLEILSQYPLPNAKPLDAYGTNNYVTSIVNTLNQYLLNNRIDYRRGRHSIYGTGGLQWDNINNPNVFGAGNAQGFNDVGQIYFDRSYYAQIGDTIVFTPTLIMDVRYGVVRDHTANLGGRTSGFTNYAAFGIAPATQALFAESGAAPNVTPAGTSTTPGTGTFQNLTPYGQFVNKQEHQIIHSGNGSVTNVKGRLTFKAGAQFQVILHNYNDFEEASANLGGCCASDQSQASYTAQYINAAGAAQNSAPYNVLPQQQGYTAAQTLVGEGVWFVRPGANLKPAYASKYFALYSQNDWKVTRSLTLNLGVRWEVQPGITERYNRLAGYDFTKPNPLFPNTMGAIDFPGTNGYSRNLWDTEWNNWSPHVGAAYQLRPNLVVRGGFSINYLPTNTGNFSSPNDYGEATWTSGNTGSQTYGASPAGIPTERITDAAPLIAATGSNVLAPQTYGVAEAYFDRHFQNGLQDQFNFTMETSFGKKAEWLFSAGYAGTRQNHLFTRNLPFQNTQTLSASAPGMLQAWRQTWINSNGATQPQTTQVANPYQPSGSLIPLQNQLAGATLQQFIPYLQYPLLYASGAGENGSKGFASYDSMQVHLAHRSTALYLDANYTWSKSLGFVQSIVGGGNISSGLDLLCNRCNRNYESQDTPHRVIVTAIYQSPFSQGQRWGGDNRVASAILGGWSLSPVFTAQDGNPITLSDSSPNKFTGRINYAGTGKGSVPLTLPKSYQHWYDGKTKVTLPCGIQVTPTVNTRLKYNLCAFSAPTVISPTGTTLVDEYYYGNGNQTNGNLRGPSRVNVDLSLRRAFKLTERFTLDITAAATNLMNSAEWSSSQSGSVGNFDTTNNPANGQIVGLSQGGTYGTANKTTYDPRQVELVGRIVF